MDERKPENKMLSDRYPNKCQACGSPCWNGPVHINCSNPECEHGEKPHLVVDEVLDGVRKVGDAMIRVSADGRLIRESVTGMLDSRGHPVIEAVSSPKDVGYPKALHKQMFDAVLEAKAKGEIYVEFEEMKRSNRLVRVNIGAAFVEHSDLEQIERVVGFPSDARVVGAYYVENTIMWGVIIHSSKFAVVHCNGKIPIVECVFRNGILTAVGVPRAV